MSVRSSSPPLRELTRSQIQWIGAGYAMAFSSLAGQTVFIAQFNTSFRETFALSHGEIGFLYTIATLMSAICLIWGGALADRIAPRVLGVICIMGLALVSLGMSQVNSVIALGCAFFGLRFFGQGMMTHLAMTIMSRWFNRFRGRALSFAQLGIPSGEAILPFAATLAIAAIGWRQVWVVTAIFLILVLAPAIAFLLRDPPDGKRALARGAINPDGDISTSEIGAKWTRRAVLKDPLFYLIIPGIMGPPAIGTLYIFHQANLAAMKGWDLTQFTAFFPVLSVTTFSTALVSGMLVDRVGAWRLMPFILIPEGIGCILIGALHPLWVVPFFFICIGMTIGMMSPILGALWAEIYGTKHIGAIRALVTSALVLASAIGPGFAGLLIDFDFTLEKQSYFYAVFCFGAAFAYWLLRHAFATRANAIVQEKASYT